MASTCSEPPSEASTYMWRRQRSSSEPSYGAVSAAPGMTIAAPRASVPVLALASQVGERHWFSGAGDAARRRGGVDEGGEGGEVGGQGGAATGAVDHRGQDVLQRLLGLHHLGLEQADHLLLAVVLRLLQAGDDDRGVELAPRELSGR